MSENFVYLHTSKFPIRWGDCDMLRHVNNTNYFSYFEETRIEWLNSIKAKDPQAINCVLASTSCNFIKPITYPALLEVKLYGGNAGNSSLMMRSEIYIEGVLCAKGDATLVFIDANTGKPVRMPEVIKKTVPKKTNTLE